ncbi:MAG TPA: DUF937 domain-containing protein, partial [Haliscomenobacter sp.]|nr:DUF937 domain-containing protein [Haliscomenobacter sp.]
GNNGAGQAGLMQNGAGIVNSLLGGKQGGIIEMISRMSGLSGDKTGNLMSMLAPIILSALSKSGQQQGGGGFDIGSILNMLQGTQTQQKASGNPAMDMIGKFLDKDGDGDFTDDLLGGLGGLFGGKK